MHTLYKDQTKESKRGHPERTACLHLIVAQMLVNYKTVEEGESGASAQENIFGWITDFSQNGDCLVCTVCGNTW